MPCALANGGSLVLLGTILWLSTLASASGNASSTSVLVWAHASEHVLRAGDKFTLVCAVRLVGLEPTTSTRSTQSTTTLTAGRWRPRVPFDSWRSAPVAEADKSGAGTRARARRSVRRRPCYYICPEYEELRQNFTRNAQHLANSLSAASQTSSDFFWLAPTPEPLLTRAPTTRPPMLRERQVAASVSHYVNVSVVNARRELVRVRVRARRVWTHDARLTMDVSYPLEEQRMRVLPTFADIDSARIDQFEIEFLVNDVRATDSPRYLCQVTDGKHGNTSDTFVQVLPSHSDNDARLANSPFGHLAMILVTLLVVALNLTCLTLGVCVVRRLRWRRSRLNTRPVLQMVADGQHEPLVFRGATGGLVRGAGAPQGDNVPRGPMEALVPHAPPLPPGSHPDARTLHANEEFQLPPPPDYCALPPPGPSPLATGSAGESPRVPPYQCSVGGAPGEQQSRLQQQQSSPPLLLLVPPPYSEVDRTKKEQRT